MKRALSIVAILFGAIGTVSGTPLESHGEVHSQSWYGNAALNWAESHAYGHWYSYGGVGPGVYDCSGLVSTAVLRATGIWIGRSTSEMLATNGHGHLRWIPLSEARRGDLLFYGSGHVEFDTVWYHTSFGAHDTGSRIGWIRWWPGSWSPTMAFQVVRN